MATQGQFVGDTVLGIIAEDVGLGQIVYMGANPADPFYDKGIWYVAYADRQQGGTDFWYGQNQLGIALQAATATPVSTTQSGTEIQILLKGYYSPGPRGFGGYAGSVQEGRPMYLDAQITATSSMFYPNKGVANDAIPTNRTTSAVVRVIGYGYMNSGDDVIRFEPDKTWIEYP
jgi:hypothetical protein